MTGKCPSRALLDVVEVLNATFEATATDPLLPILRYRMPVEDFADSWSVHAHVNRAT